MRTHIRMHFDKKTNDFNEENYISCTLDDENAESTVVATTPLPLPTVSNQISSSPDNSLPLPVTHIHHCDKCSYTTTFKGNLVCTYSLILFAYLACADTF